MKPTYGLGSRRSTPELHPLDGYSSQEAARVQSSSRSFHRAVEYDPDGEIVGEVLKPVRRMSRCEAKVAGSHRGDQILDPIEAGSGSDDIDFVALMRRLRSVRGTRRESNFQVAVDEGLG